MCAASASRNRLVSVIYTVPLRLAMQNSEYKGRAQAGQNNGVPMLRVRGIPIALGFIFVIFAAAPYPVSAQKSTATQLIEFAKSPGPALRDAITATFDEKDLKEGTAWAGHASDFFFATRASAYPLLMIDDQPGPEMHPLSGTGLWYASATIDHLGKLHSFYYTINGAKVGGNRDGNNPALNVIDNLIAQGKIPVMICIFINPGDIADSPDTPTYNFVKAYGEKW